MEVIIRVYNCYDCRTEFFTIDGIEAEQDWFVDNHDVGGGIHDEYGNRGCSNRVTDFYPINEVRDYLPPELQYLTDNDIIYIQNRLEDELVSGYCTWCN